MGRTNGASVPPARKRGAPTACVVCGCTEDHGCNPRCFWVVQRPKASAICSGCYYFLLNIRDGSKLYRVSKALGLSPDSEGMERVLSGRLP